MSKANERLVADLNAVMVYTQHQFTDSDTLSPLLERAIKAVKSIAPKDAEIARLSAALSVALAQLEEERARNAAKFADENSAIDLLATVFAAYENGIPCYDDPDGEAGAFLGHAVRLDNDTFHACADILNRLRPAPPLAIIPGAKP